jgi:hypothetical protein
MKNENNFFLKEILKYRQELFDGNIPLNVFLKNSRLYLSTLFERTIVLIIKGKYGGR